MLTKTILNLQKTIKIGVRRSDLFTVSLAGPDPAFLQNFVNTLVSQYVESNISLKRDEAYGANRFLEEQLQSFKQKLEKAEDAISILGVVVCVQFRLRAQGGRQPGGLGQRWE